MNYYERHLGDYAKDTIGLSMLEHGAYNLLIDRCYAKEDGIPEGMAYKVALARTKEEKAAVDSVLREFFKLEDGVWYKGRIQEEIAAYNAGEPEREVKKANEKNRLSKHREERAFLFKQLTDAGQHAAWNIGINELREMVQRIPKKPSTPLPATAPATPATANQAPSTIPSHQSPDIKSSASGESGDSGEEGGAAPLYVQLAVELRKAGVSITSAHPNAIAWAERGLTVKQAIEAVEIARQRKPEGTIPPNYLIGIVEDILNPPPEKSKTEIAWWTTEDGTLKKGAELGLTPNIGETMESYRQRIRTAIERKKQA